MADLPLKDDMFYENLSRICFSADVLEAHILLRIIFLAAFFIVSLFPTFICSKTIDPIIHPMLQLQDTELTHIVPKTNLRYW